MYVYIYVCVFVTVRVYVCISGCGYLFLCMCGDICSIYLVSNTLEGPPSPKGVVEPAAGGDTLRRPVDHHIAPAAQDLFVFEARMGKIWSETL